MSVSGPIYHKALERKRQQRQAAEREQARRLSEVSLKAPRLAALLDELTGLLLSIPKLGSDEARRRGHALIEERAAILKGLKLPEDYLQIHYTCPICEDSGTVADRLCDCAVTICKTLQAESLSYMLDLRGQTFESFRLDCYSADLYTENKTVYKTPPREHMRTVFAICKRFAETFDGVGNMSLLFHGNPGLGKTYLSACIAGVVNQQGYSVVYDTAIAVFRLLEKEKFGRETTAEDTRHLFECDLLILDDLGTEMLTPFVQSALYNLLDSRMRSGKSCVISTNLSPDKLSERYSAAIASRILGAYEQLHFYGKDIRRTSKETL